MRAGLAPVVCINAFPGDTRGELDMIRRAAEAAGARCAVSTHFAHGGEGAAELAEAVIEACRDKANFRYLYPPEMKLRDRVRRIARVVYGAEGVEWKFDAEDKARALEADRKYDEYSTVMVKTHFSLTHDPDIKGVPKDWRLPITDVLVYTGARFLCPVTDRISLMPGTVSDPAFRRIDVDVETGHVRGLF